MRQTAAKLLSEQKVSGVLGYKRGEFFYDNVPFLFTDSAELDMMVFDGFCAPTLSKFLLTTGKAGKKVAVFLKHCDTYNFNQLLKENRINRSLVYAIAIPCLGMLDLKKIKALGLGAIQGVSNAAETTVIIKTARGEQAVSKETILLEKCLACKGHSAAVDFEEILCEIPPMPDYGYDKFAEIRKLEAMSVQERFAFWQSELSKCIRCNACKDICPACSCEQCIFDNVEAGIPSKAASNDFEDQMYHLIRAYHVAGRCTDCGECSRICPQGIPLYLLNRKFIADINEFYGAYQAGADLDSKPPLVSFKPEDVEFAILDKKGEH